MRWFPSVLREENYFFFAAFFFGAAFFAAAGWQLHRRLWPWAVWLVATMLLYLAFPTPTPLASMPRWLVPLFPAFAAFGWWGRAAVFRAVYLVLSLVLLVLSTMLFTRWYWVA